MTRKRKTEARKNRKLKILKELKEVSDLNKNRMQDSKGNRGDGAAQYATGGLSLNRKP